MFKIRKCADTFTSCYNCRKGKLVKAGHRLYDVELTPKHDTKKYLVLRLCIGCRKDLKKML